MKCPICKTTIKDIRRSPFCPACQWELMEIPSNSSDEMKQYFRNLENNFREYHSQIKKITDLSLECSSLEKNNKAKQNNINNYNNEIEQEKKNIELKQKEYNHLKEVENEITYANQLISENMKKMEEYKNILSLSQNYDKNLQELLEQFLLCCRRGVYRSEIIIDTEELLRRKGML